MKALEITENLEKYTCIESCPIRNVIANLSGKWSMLVLCVLSENGTTRFNAIGKAIPDVSPKVLSETLKRLEADGLVDRTLYAEIPPRVEYSLTELGKSLVPHFYGLVSWALEHFDEITKNRNKRRIFKTMQFASGSDRRQQHQ